MGQRGEKLEVLLGSFDDGPVPTHMGTVVQPERKISSADRFDVIFIPGGVGAGAQTKNETLLEFVRAHKEEDRWVAANCAGMGVLHRAGVLRDVQVTLFSLEGPKMNDDETAKSKLQDAWENVFLPA